MRHRCLLNIAESKMYVMAYIGAAYLVRLCGGDVNGVRSVPILFCGMQYNRPKVVRLEQQGLYVSN